MRPGRLLAGILAACSLLPAAAPATHPIDPCSDVRSEPPLGAPARGVSDAAGDVRVFAIQYRQEIGYAHDYDSFGHKMRCLIIDLVVPHLHETKPNIVVLNEDIGLATLGLGLRGTAARAIAAGPVKDPVNLTGAIAAFGAVGAAYAPQIAYYAAAAPDTSPQRLILAAATDTFVRAFMQTFSQIAREFGVYVVASNNQAEFREVDIFDRPETAVLIDPDLADEYATLQRSTVYEAVDDAGPGQTDPTRSNFDNVAGGGAAGINVHNKAFMWSPNPDVEPYAMDRFEDFALNGIMTAADPRSNLIAVNKKTPVTQIEKDLLDITDDGDLSAENVGPFPRQAEAAGDYPHLPATTKIGFGISLPAFQWGSALNQPASCTNRFTWMRCIDEAGVTLFLQPEANPGPWASYHDASGWNPPAFQALSWHDSAWRAVADETVANIRYAVTPFMVGNLVDLAFDGQSGIFERCKDTEAGNTCDGNPGATHVGLEEWIPCPRPANHCDDPKLAAYAGTKREAMIIADWVMASNPDLDVWSNREAFVARSQAMLAGSGSPYENDYLETAIWADLDLD